MDDAEAELAGCSHERPAPKTFGQSAPPAKGKPLRLSSLGEKKAAGEPIVMVTAYDYPSAQVAEEAGVDVVLVGDSAAMTVLGYPSTVPSRSTRC